MAKHQEWTYDVLVRTSASYLDKLIAFKKVKLISIDPHGVLSIDKNDFKANEWISYTVE